MEDTCSLFTYEVTSSSAASTTTSAHCTYVSRAYIERVPIYKPSCDARSETSLSIAERAQTVPASFKSALNFADAQKQEVEESINHTDCSNCTRTEESCVISGDAENSLESNNVRRATGEASVEDGQTSRRAVAVCVSLVVNGDARDKTASSSSASHSQKALSDDAVIKVDAAHADLLNSVENSADAELTKNDDNSDVTQDHLTGWAKCSSSGQLVDCSCLNDGEQVRDKETYHVHCSEVYNGSDCVAESKEHVVSQKWYNDDGILENEELASALHNTRALNKMNEAVADKLIPRVAALGGALADENMCTDRQEILVRKAQRTILDFGDSVLAIADLTLLETGEKLDLSRGKCSQGLNVGAHDAVDEFKNVDEVSNLVSDVAASSVNKLAASCEDTDCRASVDNIFPVDACVPAGHSAKKELSEIANNIENLQSWIHSTNSEVQSKTASDDAGISLDAVEQYASELQKKKSELDQLNTQVKELEKIDVVRDERYRVVSVHAQLHSLSATLNTIASEAVTKDIEDVEKLLDHMSSKMDASAVGYDPEQLTVKFAEEEECCKEMERQCCDIDDFGRRALKVLHSGATTSHVSEVDARLEKLCRRTCTIQARLSDRLNELEEASSLAADFWSMHRDLRSSLSEIERKLNAVDTASTHSVETMQNQLREAKEMSELLSEQLSLVNDLSDYGSELSSLTGCEQIAAEAEELSRWHDCLRQNARYKVTEITAALHQAASRVSDVIDWCRDLLYNVFDQIQVLDDVPCFVGDVESQISNVEMLQGDLQHCVSAFESVDHGAVSAGDNCPEQNNDEQSLNEITILMNSLAGVISSRLEQLNKAKDCAGKYEETFAAASTALTAARKAQTDADDHVQAAGDSVEKCECLVAECHESSEPLKSACSPTAFVRVTNQLGKLDSALDDVRLNLANTTADQELETYHVDNYDNLLQTINEWLRAAEKQISEFSPIAAEQRAVRIQMEQLKAFTRQLFPRCSDIEKLAYSGGILTQSPAGSKQIAAVVNDITNRWNDVVARASERERQLSDAVMELGEIDQALDDVLGLLHETEADLLHSDSVSGDANYCELFIAKVQMLKKCLDNQQPVIEKLNAKVDTAMQRSGQTKSPIFSKLCELNETYTQVCCLAQQRRNELLDKLQQVRMFMDSVDELQRWMANYSKQLKMVKMPGALPASTQKAFDKFMADQTVLQEKLDEVKAVMLNGEEMKSRCRDDEAVQLTNKLLQLHRQTCSTVAKSNALQHNFEEHLRNVLRFHATLGKHVQWLGVTETALTGFRRPSKIVDVVEQQIAKHKSLEEDVNDHREMAKGLDVSGTYIKYFGSKRDVCSVQGQLFDAKLRWKRLTVRTCEKGRQLQQAHRKSKQFFVYWSSLCDWLNNSIELLKQPVDSSSAYHLEQFAMKLLELEQVQTGKYPSYYVALRTGRELQSLCIASDPEKTTLTEMLDELKHKWFRFKSALSEKQNDVREALLSLKQVSAVAFNVSESLQCAETNLSSSLPQLTDYENICALIDQHGLDEHNHSQLGDITSLLQDCVDVDDEMKSKLNDTYHQVTELSGNRETQLRQSLCQAPLCNFKFSKWKRRYTDWIIRNKKFTSADLFRRSNDVLTRKQFIDGLLATKFTTNRAELNTVFDAVDKKRTGKITYQQFVSVLHNDQSLMRATTDTVKIHDLVHQQLSMCKCRQKYQIQQVGDGKYKFGEKGKMYLVRFLNSCVMVRVGGGWETLPKFLENNDPCRAKGRINTELRENFILPEGASQSRISFVPRRSSVTTPSSRTEIVRASSADDILNDQSHKTAKAKSSPSQQAGKLTPTIRRTSCSSGLGTPPGARSPGGRGSPKTPASLTPSSSRSHSPAASVTRKLTTEIRNSAKHC